MLRTLIQWLRESPRILLMRTRLRKQHLAYDSEYERLFGKCSHFRAAEVSEYETLTGHAADENWMSKAALRLQVTVKKSEPNWQHGYVLYASLRRYLDERTSVAPIILETGTARGFSAVVLSRALIDSGRAGLVLTIDVLPHNEELYWNCIGDEYGPRTRKTLLNDWSEEKSQIVFLTGSSRRVLANADLPRVHFAFLDGDHSRTEFENELAYVATRQEAGDMVVCDDVGSGRYNGLDEHIHRLVANGTYDLHLVRSSPSRSYAVLTRLI